MTRVPTHTAHSIQVAEGEPGMRIASAGLRQQTALRSRNRNLARRRDATRRRVTLRAAPAGQAAATSGGSARQGRLIALRGR